MRWKAGKPAARPKGEAGDREMPMSQPGLSYRARRRLSILVLVVGLPIYIVVAVNVVELFGRPGWFAELLVFALLGILWALPLRFVFTGVGRADPGDEAPR